jgi:hypothetical protein
VFICCILDNDGYNAGRGGGMRGRGNWGYRGTLHVCFVYTGFVGIDIITKVLESGSQNNVQHNTSVM